MAAISAFRGMQHSQFFHFSLEIEFNALRFMNYTIPRLSSTYALATIKRLRGVLFIVRAGGDIIKEEFMYTKRTNCLTKMKIGIHLEELK